MKGTVWARQGSGWFYSSAAVFESAAFSATWVAKAVGPPSHPGALCCRWLFALAGVAAHFLGTNVDFALYIFTGGDGRDFFCEMAGPHGPGGPRLADASEIPLTCLLFSFFVSEAILLSPQRHRSR